MVKKYALFLGCLIPLRIPSVEIAARKVFRKLGAELVDMPGYSCCPEPVTSRLVDRDMALVVAARNLSIAEWMGLDLLVLCNGCYETLVEAQETLMDEPEEMRRVNSILSRVGRRYTGKVRVRHFLEVLYEDFGVDAVRKLVSRPMRGVSAAIHYGCHLFRPSPGQEDIWAKPRMMEELAEASGAEMRKYGVERLCCGFPSMQADEEFALKERLLPKLRKARDAGANCLLAVCPACLVQFETGQTLLRRYGEKFEFPCMHLMELLALAMGVPAAELSLDFHRSPVSRFVGSLGGV